jgi:hypothetical protein
MDIKIMGYKILDVKADIHEDIEKYFVQLNDIGNDLNHYKSDAQVQEDVLDIVDKHFEKIER